MSVDPTRLARRPAGRRHGAPGHALDGAFERHRAPPLLTAHLVEIIGDLHRLARGRPVNDPRRRPKERQVAVALRLGAAVPYDPAMNTKRPTPDIIRPNPRDSTIRIETIGVDPDKHAEFKDGLLAAARVGVADFPRLLETIREQLRDSDPKGILASFASYGLQARVTHDGVEKKMHPDILQHHAELLQAILLTIPADAWGTGLLTPQVMQTVFDTVPKLSQAFLFQRILDGQTVKDDPEALTIRSLQERARQLMKVQRTKMVLGRG
jgi:hypothetical protein